MYACVCCLTWQDVSRRYTFWGHITGPLRETEGAFFLYPRPRCLTPLCTKCRSRLEQHAYPQRLRTLPVLFPPFDENLANSQLRTGPNDRRWDVLVIDFDGSFGCMLLYM